jgi:hypothetical protein
MKKQISYSGTGIEESTGNLKIKGYETAIIEDLQ